MLSQIKFMRRLIYSKPTTYTIEKTLRCHFFIICLEQYQNQL